jgi:hypothetical protein
VYILEFNNIFFQSQTFLPDHLTAGLAKIRNHARPFSSTESFRRQH